MDGRIAGAGSVIPLFIAHLVLGIDNSTFTTFQHKFLVFVTGILRAIELLMICSHSSNLQMLSTSGGFTPYVVKAGLRG